MKVLITSDLFDSTINGVVTSVKNLEKELTKQGHEVRILTVSDQYASYQKDNVYYMKSVPAKIYPDIRIQVRGLYRRTDSVETGCGTQSM